MTPDDLANTAIERLAEDEALRGDLTDDGYLPLQRWAFDQLTRAARDAVRTKDPSATMDAAADAVRETLSAAVAVAESGDRADLADLARQLQPPAIDASAVAAVRGALQQLVLHTDPDANANVLATALAVGPSRMSAELGERTEESRVVPVRDFVPERTTAPRTSFVPPISPAASDAGADCGCEEE